MASCPVFSREIIHVMLESTELAAITLSAPASYSDLHVQVFLGVITIMIMPSLYPFIAIVFCQYGRISHTVTSSDSPDAFAVCIIIMW